MLQKWEFWHFLLKRVKKNFFLRVAVGSAFFGHFLTSGSESVRVKNFRIRIGSGQMEISNSSGRVGSGWPKKASGRVIFGSGQDPIQP